MRRIIRGRRGRSQVTGAESTERSLISPLEWYKPGVRIAHWAIVAAGLPVSSATLPLDRRSAERDQQCPV